MTYHQLSCSFTKKAVVSMYALQVVVYLLVSVAASLYIYERARAIRLERLIAKAEQEMESSDKKIKETLDNIATTFDLWWHEKSKDAVVAAIGNYLPDGIPHELQAVLQAHKVEEVRGRAFRYAAYLATRHIQEENANSMKALLGAYLEGNSPEESAAHASKVREDLVDRGVNVDELEELFSPAPA